MYKTAAAFSRVSTETKDNRGFLPKNTWRHNAETMQFHSALRRSALEADRDEYKRLYESRCQVAVEYATHATKI